MEQMLIYIIVLCVFAAIVIAVLGYFGFAVPRVLIQIAIYIGVGILAIFIIRLMWPMLRVGDLGVAALTAFT